MILQDLLGNLVEIPAQCPGLQSTVVGLQIDSRQVEAAQVFIAYPGYAVDGRLYIQQALERGASAIICEQLQAGDSAQVRDACQQAQAWCRQHKLAFVWGQGLMRVSGKLASRFYANPSQHLKVVAVTGTNGKTTVTTWVAQALAMQGVNCAVIGTLGAGVLGDLKNNIGTTPDPISLQRTLAEFYQQGVKVVAMEVSSHALVQGRIAGVQVDVAVLTQLSQDHLDFHKTMQAYAEAKAQLFALPNLSAMVLNINDDLGKNLFKRYSSSQKKLFAYRSFASGDEMQLSADHDPKHNFLSAQFAGSEHNKPDAGLAKFIGPWGESEMQLSCIGRFNLDNLLAVLGVMAALAGEARFVWQDALHTISQLQPPCGRMQAFGGGRMPRVIVDYAHSPDAIKKVLQTLRELTSGQLIIVFGCGGERDQAKRPLMGAIASEFADQVIITNDNPRCEDPERIASDIQAGIDTHDNFHIELDRQRAICYAVAHAKAGDVVLVAGKGHENYQEINGSRIALSDQDLVQAALGVDDSG